MSDTALLTYLRRIWPRRTHTLTLPPKPAGSQIDCGAILSVDEVQKRYLEILKRVETALEAQFIAVDIYSSPSVKFWFIDPTSRISSAAILQELAKHDIYVDVHLRNGQVHYGRGIELLQLPITEPHQSIATLHVYDLYYRGQTLVHGKRSAVIIEFPVLHPIRSEYVGWKYSFVQAQITNPIVSQLPTTSILGFEFLATPNLARLRSTGTIPEEIDVVYTWVDGHDPAWAARRAEAAGCHGRLTSDATDSARYLQRNELLYSLSSTLTFLKGVRKIYVVTDQQRPTLPTGCDGKINIVDHREIFNNPSDLPTFNSHSIEAQLHRIPGLSEKYLYLNDDFFFGRSVTPFLFFDEYGRSRYFVSNAVTIPEGPATEADRGVDAAAKNARDFLHQRYGIFVSRKFKHAPVPMIKNVVHEMEQEFPEIFLTTAGSRFRAVTDFCVSGSFYYHYAALTGRAAEGQIRYSYFDINSSVFSTVFPARVTEATEGKRFDTFCVNDVVRTEHTDGNERIFRNAMTSLFANSNNLDREPE